jgi:GH15 family glucan-1,4-alpha-glucosidase
MTSGDYPPIGDYAYIADCHTGALVSLSGSIDWCCMPRYDSGACFGRVLDWRRAGHCSIAPHSHFAATRRYVGNSLVLETTFETSTGTVRLTDFFSMRPGGKHDPRRDICRVVEGLAGEVKLGLEVVPRFDYGAIKPWMRAHGDGLFTAVGGNDGLLIWSDANLGMVERHDLEGKPTITEGEKLHLWLQFRRPELIDEGPLEAPDAEQISKRLQETLDWWEHWARRCNMEGAYAETALRSAIVLKGLTNSPTGAIVAAPTTSLPESPGGSRNWDYRYTWIRDSTFTTRSLGELGFTAEADGFRRFIERTAAGSAEELQIMFGLSGERRLGEEELDYLDGYRGARPVRVGNAAQAQLQLDMYGELLGLASRWHDRGHSPDDDYWEFIVQTVDAACRLWPRPDQGLWEMRGEPRHFVHSKVMCWAALDYGLQLAEDLGRDAPVDEWAAARDGCRDAIEAEGFDEEQGAYVQSFGHPELDASALLFPSAGYIAYDDKRMVSTTDVLRRELETDGLLMRYTERTDGMPGAEGTFLSCSFWLVECLAHQGRLDEAHAVFQRAAGTANDLGLLSEEYDVEVEQMLGNFPQALSHLSLITAIVALSDAETGRA